MLTDGDNTQWIMGRIPVEMSRGAVHVWRFPLRPVHPKEEQSSREGAALEQWRELLSPEECARADGFRVLRAKEDFLAARGMLRWIAAELLKEDPRNLRFEAGPFGKPKLVRRSGTVDLRFNLSHSGDLGVLAFAVEREIGVDVEVIRDIRDAVAIGGRHFTPEEQQLLRHAEKRQDLPQTFFKLWTRKEALLKASGRGLSLRLNSFDVSCLREGGDQLRLAASQPTTWWITDLLPAPGCCGAIAVEHCSSVPVVHYWAQEWPKLL